MLRLRFKHRLLKEAPPHSFWKEAALSAVILVTLRVSSPEVRLSR